MQPMTLDIPVTDAVLRMAAAILAGAILGVNRDLRDKPAGLKTHSLVALGSALLTIVSLSFAGMAAAADGTAIARVVQGIITGIGFLGAGTILRHESGKAVEGLTTAASVWLAGCLGIAIGAGQWVLALVAWAATLFVLVAGDPVERAIYQWWHRRSERRGGT